MKAPAVSSWASKSAIDAPSDIESAALRSDRFRLEREDDWRRLEEIIVSMEKGGLSRIDDEDLLALPTLYRTAASSLSVARETSLDAATLNYLESLVQRAWFQVYGPRKGFFAWFKEFILGGWSRAVREIWLDVCVALFVMVAGAIVGWLLVAQDQDWYYRIVPAQFGETRVPGATKEALLETLAAKDNADGLGIFGAFLFQNNAGVAILAFALGFAFGVPSLLLLVYNLATLGAMMWVFASQDLHIQFAAWLSIHGTTELFAILLSGAAGMHIGRSMAFPGEKSVLASAAEAGKRGAVVMVGVTIMMVAAGILESYGRELIESSTVRFSIGGSLLVFWLTYFFLYAPRQVEE